jgi:hypothetical protein
MLRWKTATAQLIDLRGFAHVWCEDPLAQIGSWMRNLELVTLWDSADRPDSYLPKPSVGRDGNHP